MKESRPTNQARVGFSGNPELIEVLHEYVKEGINSGLPIPALNDSASTPVYAPRGRQLLCGINVFVNLEKIFWVERIHDNGE
jgi:hypothetical protein